MGPNYRVVTYIGYTLFFEKHRDVRRTAQLMQKH